MRAGASRPARPSFFPLVASGAAAGALAFVAIALIEIVRRGGGELPLLWPARDASQFAIAGAVLGALIGSLRRSRRLSSLSPFGLALGGGIGFGMGLDRVVTGPLEGGRALELAVFGAAVALVGAVFGQIIGRLLARVRPIAPRPARDLGIVAALAIPALWPLPSPPSESPPSERNVLLLTIDTLRADRLGFAGCPRGVSPYLDRLARTGTVEIRAITPLPRTLPALASILTGCHPPTHGVRDNFHYRLDAEAITLPERLRAAGWTTAAVNSNPVLSHDCGIYQGFESANDRGNDWSRLGILRGLGRLRTLIAMRSGNRARVIADLAVDWLRRRDPDRPHFLWTHWLAPHMPYEPAFPFDRVWDRGYDGEYARRFDYGTVSKGTMTYRNPLSPRVREHVKALYDGEIASADRALGRLLRAMERAGDLENTIVLFTSDHGESLDEHRYFFNHGDFVYGPATNVPLIWSGFEPKATGTLRNRPVSLVDCLPAVLAAAMGEANLPDVDGRWPVPGDRALHGESGFCRFPHLNDRLGWLLPRPVAQNPDLVEDWQRDWEAQAIRAKQRFVEVDGWKLVRSPDPEGDRHELFDLGTDPGERVDVAEANPERVRELAAVLDRWLEAAERGPGTASARVIDEATRERMNSLGYLGD